MRPDLRDGYSAAQVRAAEQPLLAAGVPLMDRAATALATEVERVLAARGRRTGRLVVLAGSGSNGGDALLAAAMLLTRGNTGLVVLLGSRAHPRGLRDARRAGARVLPPDTAAGAIAAAVSAADVVLDGVLGTGARGGLRSPAWQIVGRILEAAGRSAAVVAVDLPSGVDPDTGAVAPPVLRADHTVTFGANKAGLLRRPGSGFAGRVRVIDIGLGSRLVDVEPLVRHGS